MEFIFFVYGNSIAVNRNLQKQHEWQWASMLYQPIDKTGLQEITPESTTGKASLSRKGWPFLWISHLNPVPLTTIHFVNYHFYF